MLGMRNEQNYCQVSETKTLGSMRNNRSQAKVREREVDKKDDDSEPSLGWWEDSCGGIGSWPRTR